MQVFREAWGGPRLPGAARAARARWWGGAQQWQAAGSVAGAGAKKRETRATLLREMGWGTPLAAAPPVFY